MRYQITITNLTQDKKYIVYLTPSPKVDVHTLLIPEGSNASDKIQVAVDYFHGDSCESTQIIANIEIPPPPAHFSKSQGIARVSKTSTDNIILTIEYAKQAKQWSLQKGTITIPQKPDALQHAIDFTQASYILTVIQNQIDTFQREMNMALTEKWRLEGLLEDAKKVIANRERDIGVLEGMFKDEREKLSRFRKN